MVLSLSASRANGMACYATKMSLFRKIILRVSSGETGIAVQFIFQIMGELYFTCQLVIILSATLKYIFELTLIAASSNTIQALPCRNMNHNVLKSRIVVSSIEVRCIVE